MTPEQDPFSVVDALKWLAGALGAVGLWILNQWKLRIEANEVSHKELVETVRELQMSTVSRDTHQRHESDTKDALDAMRHEAIGREDRIVAEIRGLGNRIDTLFQRADR